MLELRPVTVVSDTAGRGYVKSEIVMRSVADDSRIPNVSRTAVRLLVLNSVDPTQGIGNQPGRVSCQRLTDGCQ